MVGVQENHLRALLAIMLTDFPTLINDLFHDRIVREHAQRRPPILGTRTRITALQIRETCDLAFERFNARSIVGCDMGLSDGCKVTDFLHAIITQIALPLNGVTNSSHRFVVLN